MSFYINIEGKTLKIGNQVIIGRGSPFENLLSCKDISRAHAKILKKGQKYYIKDLGSETGTYVNGKKIIPNKLVTISQEDTITLGKRELKFSLTCEDGQFETVRRFKNLKKTNSFWTLFFIIFSISIALLLIEKGKIAFSQILFSTIFAFFCAMIGSFLSNLSKSNKLLISEILIGDQGLTIHYPD
ncbi:MAG: FHA domain-containing protein [Bacteriovoracaceae bacterium]|nr:FHA domain-containing protein [Bacteriovoracaceae bacterium]